MEILRALWQDTVVNTVSSPQHCPTINSPQSLRHCKLDCKVDVTARHRFKAEMLVQRSGSGDFNIRRYATWGVSV